MQRIEKGINLSDFCDGRQSYAQKLYLMDKASPEKQHGRVDVWLKSCERPDGTVPESIREKYEQVKLAHERIMSSTSNEKGIDNYIGLNSDALAEVFGPEKKTYTRGVRSYTSKKQVQIAAIGKALLHNADSSTSKLEAQMEVVRSDIKNMSKAFMVRPNENLYLGMNLVGYTLSSLITCIQN
ncbi:hypothetical protein FRX31_025927 [Thalictrum thalictroides]|uniref:Uncharacterized protein n=1 Tax=Thalictrum thalictroides TaxID=46969 RepID=A0A7J6VIB2_THATH|nr:hypothetical protein FRX31_025927 [Thalictrum thalictroides]